MNNFKFGITNILVIGDLMIDHYLWGKCERISPEAPVQVVNVQKESSALGGAGNVINNLRAMGSNVLRFTDFIASKSSSQIDGGVASFVKRFSVVPNLNSIG
jgi:D-beta-D-heptose 7-phosphate kinase/D-beta-D-heptose 1-phosphate adenosyltransferase